MDFGLHNEPNASSIFAKEVRKPTYNRINLLAGDRIAIFS